MNKNWLILIVILAVLGVGIYLFMSGMPASAPTTSVSTSTSGSAPVAGPGGRCGGNFMPAPVCGYGYHCAPEPGSHLPFGDVGGICVKN